VFRSSAAVSTTCGGEALRCSSTRGASTWWSYSCGRRRGQWPSLQEPRETDTTSSTGRRVECHSPPCPISSRRVSMNLPASGRHADDGSAVFFRQRLCQLASTGRPQPLEVGRQLASHVKWPPFRYHVLQWIAPARRIGHHRGVPPREQRQALSGDIGTHRREIALLEGVAAQIEEHDIVEEVVSAVHRVDHHPVIETHAALTRPRALRHDEVVPAGILAGPKARGKWPSIPARRHLLPQ